MVSGVVWTITDLGPGDGPGLVVPAELAGGGPGFGRFAAWRYDEWAARSPEHRKVAAA